MLVTRPAQGRVASGVTWKKEVRTMIRSLRVHRQVHRTPR